MFSNSKSVGLPFDVAAALGCSPGQERVVTVTHPLGRILITVGLQATPKQRTVLSGLAEVLRRIDVMDGDLMKLSVNRERQLEVSKLTSETTVTSARSAMSVAALAPTVRSHYLRRAVPESQQTSETSPQRSVVVPGTGVTVNAARLLSEILPRWSLAIRSTALICDEAELVVAAARELRGAKSLGDLLRLDLADLLAAAEADSALNEIPLEDDNPSLAERAVEAIEACLGRMSDTERLLATQRVAASEPKSRKEIAAMAGVSRERIRQLDKRVRSALHTAAGSILGLLSLAVTERLGYVTTRPEIENTVVEFLPSSNCNSDAAHSLTVTRQLLQDRLGYKCRNELCLSREAAQAAETLRHAAQNLVDDTGLIDSEQLRQALAPEFQDEIEILVHWLGWHRLSERVATKATARARTKAALLKISKPATKAELAAESGLTEQKVGGALSSIKSVARATKDRWGLREWIDDVYEGIPAEIIQRINEDGGSTRLNRVLDELPRLFNVSESSVWAYLNTPAFIVEHGYVTEATEFDLQLGSLTDVVDGFTDEGDPYWTFEMMDRHLHGYSLHGVPPEISVALGCLFGGSTKVPVRYPQGCQDISVIWRKTSIHGPEIGRLGETLRALNFCDGTVVGLVIHKDKKVSLRAADDCRKNRKAAEMDKEQAFTGSPTANSSILQGVKAGPPISAHLNIKLQRTSHKSRRVKVDDE